MFYSFSKGRGATIGFTCFGLKIFLTLFGLNTFFAAPFDLNMIMPAAAVALLLGKVVFLCKKARVWGPEQGRTESESALPSARIPVREQNASNRKGPLDESRC